MLSLMDVFMKQGSLTMGAYMAALLRAGAAFAIALPLWLAGRPLWPGRRAMRIHLVRGTVGALMALTFFFALTRLPVAETIAISFFAPILALYLSAALLHEPIHPRTIGGAVLGLAGVFVIIGGKLSGGGLSNETWGGLAAIGFSSLLYAWNLVLQRQQALIARPTEVATFYFGVASLVYLLAAPWLFAWPGSGLPAVGVGAILTVGGALTMAWAYARAEAQLLVPLEYSGFLWATAFGWLLLAEHVTPSAAGGAVLIVAGCWIATRRPAAPTPAG